MPVENAMMLGAMPYSHISPVAEVVEGKVYAGTPFAEPDVTRFCLESPDGNYEVISEVDGTFERVVPLLDSSQPTLDNLCGIFHGSVIRPDFFSFPIRGSEKRELRDLDSLKFAYLLESSNPDSLAFGAFNGKTTQVTHPALGSYELPGEVLDVTPESFFGRHKEHLLTFFHPKGICAERRVGVINGKITLEGYSDTPSELLPHNSGLAFVFGNHLVYANSKGNVNQLDLGSSFHDSSSLSEGSWNNDVQLFGVGRNAYGPVGFCIANDDSLQKIENLSKKTINLFSVSGHLGVLVPSWSGKVQLAIGNHRGPFASSVLVPQTLKIDGVNLTYEVVHEPLLGSRKRDLIIGSLKKSDYRTFREQRS